MGIHSDYCFFMCLHNVNNIHGLWTDLWIPVCGDVNEEKSHRTYIILETCWMHAGLSPCDRTHLFKQQIEKCYPFLSPSVIQNTYTFPSTHQANIFGSFNVATTNIKRLTWTNLLVCVAASSNLFHATSCYVKLANLIKKFLVKKAKKKF